MLAGLTAIVLIGTGSSSEEGTGAPAPLRCLEAWNSDSLAIEYGRHNSLSHGYSDAQVGRMPQEGSASLSSKPDAGECAVVFAAEQLDPEPVAAGQIHDQGQWVPLSTLLEPAGARRAPERRRRRGERDPHRGRGADRVSALSGPPSYGSASGANAAARA